MKLFVLIVCLVWMAGCSAPQAPAIQGPTTITGLSIPDTIDFGVVQVGVAKDSNVTFRNTGSDTIQITSQGFSNSSFKLTDTSLTRFSIAPGGNRVVGISFTPKDTLPALGLDTIKAGNKSDILTLRGESIPYVSYAKLSIPDTIDFGVVRTGITKDSNVIFKNTGTDTIKITSERFSNSSFKLSYTSQSQLIIAPGASQSVTIQYTPSDTSAILCCDTIRTPYRTNILVLRGKAIPFSYLFPSPPSWIDIELSGLIGKDKDGTTHPFSFSFSAPVNLSGSKNNSFSFYVSAEQITYDGSRPTDIVDDNSSKTSVYLLIDTANLSIDTLTASYFESDQKRNQIPTGNDEGVNLHGITLQKDSDVYSATVVGSGLSSIVGAAYFDTWNQSRGNLKSIVGYQASAKLTILIQ